MQFIKKCLVVITSLMAVGSIAFGMHQAMHSKMFLLSAVEIESSTDEAPLSEQAILRLAAIPIGKEGLFQVDLQAIERRLLSSEWIQDVRIQKRFLHKIIVTVIYRQPVAMIQSHKGSLSFVDTNGKIFGSVDLMHCPNLPILSGFSGQDSEKIKSALEVVHKWETSSLKKYSTLSSISWDVDRGYRVLVSYALGVPQENAGTNLGSYARTMIDLGNEVDANLDGKLLRLITVFRYLTGNSIAARQVWADAGKKVVVKTVRGS
jgi:hypothetical protein